MTARESALMIALSVAVAIVMSWPLTLHLSSKLPQGASRDPFYLAWEVAWEGHALVHQPQRFYDANIFWPARDSLALTDVSIGYAPAGLLGSGLTAAVIRYNVLWLFSYALAFSGAYLLARELTSGVTGAVIAGASFAYAPWRLAQQQHLHILSTGGIPLSLFLLLRGWREKRPVLILTGWLVATWQLSLGFGLGLQFAYLIGVIVSVSVVLWLALGRPHLDSGAVVASSVGLAIFVSVGLILAIPYYRVAREHPEMRVQRTVDYVGPLSPPPSGYLAAPRQSFVWGGPTRSFREGLSVPGEQTLFPGVLTVLLAGAAVVASRHPRRLTFGLLAAVVVSGILSLGFGLLHGNLGYRLLWAYAPGWQGIRTPGRTTTMTTLGLALLAGLGGSLVVRAILRSPQPTIFSRVVAVGVSAVLVGGILLEGAGRTPYVTIPSAPTALDRAQSPRLDLPASHSSDFLYQFWSTDGFPPLVNGYSRFMPCTSAGIRWAVRSFPDRRSVAFLESLGVRTVVLHTDLARDSPWRDVQRRPVLDLGLRTERVDHLVIYHLQPMASDAWQADPAVRHCFRLGAR